ncbi:MAG: dienelactone hydrolase family protein [Phycisphaeraceae bacterium]|nr:dienelactone hydrolase family protein [Phycisphaeraceae bacterium]
MPRARTILSLLAVVLVALTAALTTHAQDRPRMPPDMPENPTRPSQPQNPRFQPGVLAFDVDYQHDGHALRGMIAEPRGLDIRGTVLIVHQWRGLGDEEKQRARMLAELGYRAFAIDMYGAGVWAADTEEAARRATEFYNNRPLMRARVQAAIDALKRDGRLTSNLAAIGYCFGGTVVLECARAGFDLNAAVSFHGGLAFDGPPEVGQVKAAVLVCNGNADPLVSHEDRVKFKREMEAARADFIFIDYAKAVHSFTSKAAGAPAPGKATAYDEAADKRSWQAMRALFEETMR